MLWSETGSAYDLSVGRVSCVRSDDTASVAAWKGRGNAPFVGSLATIDITTTYIYIEI